MQLLLSAALLAGFAAPAMAAPIPGDAGKALFAGRCAACHMPTAAKSSPIAPRIVGVYGRKIASLGDYAYSTALKGKGGQSWSDASLDSYITAPAKFAPGTKMVVAVSKPEDRRAIVAYLKTLK